MGMFEAYLDGWKRYADFSGESTRTEYWSFTLINVVLLYTIVFGLSFITGGLSSNLAEVVASGMTIIILIFSLALFIPSLAITIRRLHDTGKSGWWILLRIIPFGGLVVFVFLVSPSTYGGYRA